MHCGLTVCRWPARFWDPIREAATPNDAEQYRVEEWTGGEDLHTLHELRYTVLVEEMGKYGSRADHDQRILADEEDAHSWHTVALSADGTIAAANRLTWGGGRLSERQIEQYQLQPWIDEGLGHLLAVGERTIVAPDHRGGPAVHLLSADVPTVMTDHDVRIVFGACEPHLLSLYISMGQMPYSKKNINNEEAGFLVPLVMFMPDANALRGEGIRPTAADGSPALPDCVVNVVTGHGTVTSQTTAPSPAYLQSIRDSLDTLTETQMGAFDDLSEQEIERCLSRSNIIDCNVGDKLLKAGGAGRNLFVVLSGNLEAHDGDRVVGVLCPGDVFGEMAFLLDQPRSVDVYAATADVRVLSLSHSAIRKMIVDDATVAAKVLLNVSRMLCVRLVKANSAADVANLSVNP